MPGAVGPRPDPGTLVLGADDAPAGDLLLVHGNELSGPFYRLLGEALVARGLRVVLPTLPGFHGTPPLARPGWPALVASLDPALAALRPGATLAGHSLGGAFAVLCAVGRPAKVARLVLLEPLVLPGRRFARAAARRYLRDVVSHRAGPFQNWTGSFLRVADPARFPAAALALHLEARRCGDVGTVRALFETLEQQYPLPLDRLTLPILLLEGRLSGLRMRLLMRALRGQLRRVAPRVEHVRLPGAAHWMANEVDAALAEHIARFAAATPAGAAAPR